MTKIDTSTEAVERLAKHIKSTCGCALGSDAEQPVAETLHSLLKERDEARARARALEDALRGMMDREARIALRANGHKPLWEASPEWIAAWNTRAALAAIQPADPVTKAGCCQPVQVKPLEWGDKGDSAWADHQFGWYEVFEFDRGFVLTQSAVEIGVHSALDAAKAAAQADYEARILSALEPAPVTPAEAAKVQALVDAGERMTGPLWRLILADENCIKNPCDLPTCECRQKFDRIAGPWFAAIAALKEAAK